MLRAAFTEALVASPAWLTRARVRLYARAAGLSLIAGVTLAVAFGEGSSALVGRLGGDFPAFYAAGRLVLRGAGAELYDWHAQAGMQQGAFPRDSAFLLFAYPPYVAPLYAPLAALPFRSAYVLHTVLMAFALWLAVWALARSLPSLAEHRFTAFCLGLAFLPMFIAWVGAQPAPLLLLLLALGLRDVLRGRERSGGMWLGLLLLKPQYGAPLLLALLAARRFRVLAGALGSAAACYAVGAFVLGAAWPLTYLAALARFHAADQRINAAHSIGFSGVSEALLGAATWPALALGASASAACLVFLLRGFWRSSRASFAMDLARAVPLCLLLSPHAMYYDAGLLLLTLAVAFERCGPRVGGGLLLSFVVALLAPFGDVFGVSPVFGLVLLVLWLSTRQNTASAGT